MWFTIAAFSGVYGGVPQLEIWLCLSRNIDRGSEMDELVESEHAERLTISILSKTAQRDFEHQLLAGVIKDQGAGSSAGDELVLDGLGLSEDV